MSAPSAVLAARALSCRRGERVLVKDLDLEVHPGDIVWLRGPNGSGKTSLLRVLAGLSPPAGGTVERGTLPRLYLAHQNALKDDLSALEALQFLARLQGHAGDAAACTEGLRAVGLFSRRSAPVRQLSQGQRRRIALARLWLSTAPALWILDEPYDALDVDGITMLNGALSAQAARGGAVLLTSHLDLALDDREPRTVFLGRPASATLQ